MLILLIGAMGLCSHKWLLLMSVEFMFHLRKLQKIEFKNLC